MRTLTLWPFLWPFCFLYLLTASLVAKLNPSRDLPSTGCGVDISAPFVALRAARITPPGLASRAEHDPVVANRVVHRDVHLHDVEPNRLLGDAPVRLVLGHGRFRCFLEAF